jgi:hypothetical protein
MKIMPDTKVIAEIENAITLGIEQLNNIFKNYLLA